MHAMHNTADCYTKIPQSHQACDLYSPYIFLDVSPSEWQSKGRWVEGPKTVQLVEKARRMVGVALCRSRVVHTCTASAIRSVCTCTRGGCYCEGCRCVNWDEIKDCVRCKGHSTDVVETAHAISCIQRQPASRWRHVSGKAHQPSAAAVALAHNTQLVLTLTHNNSAGPYTDRCKTLVPSSSPAMGQCTCISTIPQTTNYASCLKSCSALSSLPLLTLS